MIHFKIPEEVQDLLEVLKEFSTQEIRPNYREWEKAGSLPEAFLKKYHKLGLSGLSLPENLGGSALNLEAEVYVWDCLCRYGDVGVSYSLPGPSFGGDFILHLGDEDQQKRFLSPFLEEAGFSKKIAFLIREEDPNFEWNEVSTSAKKTENGFVLNGQKNFVLHGKDAELYVVLAKEESGALAMFVLEKGTEGLNPLERVDLMGLNTAGFHHVKLNDVLVKPENKLVQTSLDEIQHVYNRVRIKNGAMCLGTMKASCDASFRYGNERSAFGKTLWKHQGLAFFMAEMACELEMAEANLIKAAVEFDKKNNATVANALAILEKSSLNVVSNAVQVFGGAGFVQDYPVEKWMRDVRTATVILEVDPFYTHQILS